MQSIWQTITAPPVTIPFSLMWLCVFALELIMLPERIRLARYGGYWYMYPYDYRTTQMVSGRRIWHRFASAAVAATWMWYTAMEHSPLYGQSGLVDGQGLRIVQEHGRVRLFRHDTSRHTQSPISVGFSMVRPP